MSDDFRPSEIQHRDFYAEVRALDDEPRTITATISTDSVDRMGDVIEQDGWDLTAYKRNPVVLWSHDYSIPPIGKAVDLRVVGGRLKATTQFADTQLGRDVFGLYRGGFMSTFSVGFRPLDWKPIKDSDGKTKGMRFMRSELLEYSAVPVPANAEAVVEMRQIVARGMLTETLRYLPASVTGLPADTVEVWAKRWLDQFSALEKFPAIKRFLSEGVTK